MAWHVLVMNMVLAHSFAHYLSLLPTANISFANNSTLNAHRPNSNTQKNIQVHKTCWLHARLLPVMNTLKQCLSLKLLKHWAHHARIFSQQIFSICMYHDGNHFKRWNDLNSSNQCFHSRRTFPLFKSHLVYDAEHLALYSNDLIVIFCRWPGNNKRQWLSLTNEVFALNSLSVYISSTDDTVFLGN